MFDFIVENWDFIFSCIVIVGSLGTALFSRFGWKWAQTIAKICDKVSIVNTKQNKEKIEKLTKKK